jgi:putative restriction endonuclease
MALDHEGRARRAWPLLVAMAKRRREPLTYAELSARLGLHHRAAAWILDLIQDWCSRNRLPPLQALVVNARTRLPGSGAKGVGSDERQHRRALERVYNHADWPARAPRD